MVSGKGLGYTIGAVGVAAFLIASNRVVVQSQAPQSLGPFANMHDAEGNPFEFQRPGERDLLYVTTPGTGEFSQNGDGIMVFDVYNKFKFVKRIPLGEHLAWHDDLLDEVKGVAINVPTGRAIVSTLRELLSVDLYTEKVAWRSSCDGAGCDRVAVSPDGKLIYAPELGPRRSQRTDGWLAIDATTGKLITRVASDNTHGAHNTIFSLDGSRVFMGALNSRYMNVADTKTHTIVQTVGPFGTDKEVAFVGGQGRGVIRPFTINGRATLVYVNVVGLLGFEVGDVTTGKVIARVDLSDKFPWTRSMVRGHATPSHGIALSPDEKEVWLVDSIYGMLHVFDVTVMPPRQITSVTLPGKSRLGPTEVDHAPYPYWITFGLDGKYVFPSTGDIVDAKTKRVIGALIDEYGRPVRSEKLSEAYWSKGKLIRATNQFGVGLVTGATSTQGPAQQ